MSTKGQERMRAKVDAARKEVVERVLSLMQEKDLSWIREWSISMYAPYNAESGRRYTGGNRLYLMGKYDDPRWFTFAQARRQGFFPRKGEKSSIVEYWKPRHAYKDAEGNIVGVGSEETPEGAVPFTWLQLANVYNVFNATQLADAEGRPYPNLDVEGETPVLDDALCSVADKLIEASRCRVNEVFSNRAFYSPTSDEITVPIRTKFRSMESFLGTLTHEMTHSTGIVFGRDVRNSFGSQDYAYEELIAELGSLFCCMDLGIEKQAELESDENFSNHAAYLQSWMKALEDDPAYLFRAAAEADKACSFIMNRAA